MNVHHTTVRAGVFEPDLAKAWNEFVDPPRRLASGHASFLTDVLSCSPEGRFRVLTPDKYRGPISPRRLRILDAAAATGADSAFLLGKGHSVHANEIDPTLARFAVEQIKTIVSGEVELTRFDWRELESRLGDERFDAILILGNALCCLPNTGEMLRCLAQFRRLLRPGGLLIVDERNYPAIFKFREVMEQPEFRFAGRVIYCGESIKARPIRIPRAPGDPDHRLGLEYLRGGERIGTFDVYPYRSGELGQLLANAGFGIVEIRLDYCLTEASPQSLPLAAGADLRQEPEFVTWVATPTPQPSGESVGSP